ncbi:MAG: N-acetylglucosamine kinase [Lutibacter sp.]|uniref:N-acetylglucosamine kinase n=1 Tax=Lutibacter sp. TaxID=1925666 RepID=UPI003859C854
MILIADGGSTKADWILLDSLGKVVLKTRTEGLNPAVFPGDLLKKRVEENKDFQFYKNKIEEVYFYGAGCGTKKPTALLKSILESFFIKATVVVKEDTYAATYAVTTKPGIVCILGTGSNSSYFDGKNIINGVPSLGYILMDEASGNYFGKRLIRDYYYKRMPKRYLKKFEDQFDVDPDVIKRNVYKENNPNTYLAHFAEFIFRNDRNAYSDKVLEKGINVFFKTRILTYPQIKNVPVHFVGSIAFFAKDIIEKVAKKYDVELGSIVRRPIDGLIEYHRRKINLEKI